MERRAYFVILLAALGVIAVAAVVYYSLPTKVYLPANTPIYSEPIPNPSCYNATYYLATNSSVFGFSNVNGNVNPYDFEGTLRPGGTGIINYYNIPASAAENITSGILIDIRSGRIGKPGPMMTLAETGLNISTAISIGSFAPWESTTVVSGNRTVELGNKTITLYITALDNASAHSYLIFLGDFCVYRLGFGITISNSITTTTSTTTISTTTPARSSTTIPAPTTVVTGSSTSTTTTIPNSTTLQNANVIYPAAAQYCWFPGIIPQNAPPRAYTAVSIQNYSGFSAYNVSNLTDLVIAPDKIGMITFNITRKIVYFGSNHTAINGSIAANNKILLLHNVVVTVPVTVTLINVVNFTKYANGTIFEDEGGKITLINSTLLGNSSSPTPFPNFHNGFGIGNGGFGFEPGMWLSFPNGTFEMSTNKIIYADALPIGTTGVFVYGACWLNFCESGPGPKPASETNVSVTNETSPGVNIIFNPSTESLSLNTTKEATATISVSQNTKLGTYMAEPTMAGSCTPDFLLTIGSKPYNGTVPVAPLPG